MIIQLQFKVRCDSGSATLKVIIRTCVDEA